MEHVELNTSRQLDSVRFTWNMLNCTHLHNLMAFGPDVSFADQIYMLKKRLDKRRAKLVKRWQIHVMLLGAHERGDSCPLITCPTPVVTRNGGRPPTESLPQIRRSDTCKKSESKSSCICADGNQNWENLASEFGLEERSVTRQVKQFTKPVPTAKTSSSVAGTQTLDHSWGLVKTWLPAKRQPKVSPTKVRITCSNTKFLHGSIEHR